MQIKIKNRISKVVISHLGRATFGVFILHVGSAFWYWTDFWNRLKTFGKAPTVIEMVYKVLAATVLIYVAASLISLLRIYIFKLLRIHKAVDFFADLPEKISKKRRLKKENASDGSRTQNEK